MEEGSWVGMALELRLESERGDLSGGVVDQEESSHWAFGVLVERVSIGWTAGQCGNIRPSTEWRNK